MKKVLIISTSLRSGSNSEILAKEAARGALDAKNDVEFISLKDKDIRFCKGCLACQVNHKCVIKDDMETLINKVKEAEVIIYATPIYYYEMSGLMKTFLDRCNPLYGLDNRFKDIYLIATCADENKEALDRAINGLGGWIECFEGVAFKGAVYGVGINDAKDASNHGGTMQEAYSLGKNV